MVRASQNRAILQYLKTHKGITALQALKRFGCFRLSARIWDLRHGRYADIMFQIKSWTITMNGKRFVQYSLCK
ncbi:MAG TPA: helix-turn-helix domain-containing protein [Candidatus Omnitrophota bacterium]|nr:helix-turn-helix domain-containing protein [Candidatus Omnitrophota bacterium]